MLPETVSIPFKGPETELKPRIEEDIIQGPDDIVCITLRMRREQRDEINHKIRRKKPIVSTQKYVFNALIAQLEAEDEIERK